MPPPPVCPVCTHATPACICPSTTRTTSVHTLLSTTSLPPHAHHLTLFLYHTYHRTTPPLALTDFCISALPPWEGWYTAWLKPSAAGPTSSPAPVLPCTLHYPNGSVATAHISRDGTLLLRLPTSPPPAHTPGYDHDRRVLLTAPAVSQALSEPEIRACTRGVVHHPRRVSHVVAVGVGQRDAAVRMLALPRGNSAGRAEVVVQTERVTEYAPYLMDEFQWRMRRRFTSRVAEGTQRFLVAFLKRVDAEERAVRAVLGRRWTRVHRGLAEQVEAVKRKMRRLAQVNPDCEDGDPGDRPAKRARCS